LGAFPEGEFVAEEKVSLALNVELVDEAEETQTPIRLSSMPPGRW
jgi:hypothetical protein